MHGLCGAIHYSTRGTDIGQGQRTQGARTLVTKQETLFEI